jgi:hypothetical protein
VPRLGRARRWRGREGIHIPYRKACCCRCRFGFLFACARSTCVASAEEQGRPQSLHSGWGWLNRPAPLERSVPGGRPRGRFTASWLGSCRGCLRGRPLFLGAGADRASGCSLSAVPLLPGCCSGCCPGGPGLLSACPGVTTTDSAGRGCLRGRPLFLGTFPEPAVRSRGPVPPASSFSGFTGCWALCIVKTSASAFPTGTACVSGSLKAAGPPDCMAANGNNARAIAI